MTVAVPVVVAENVTTQMPPKVPKGPSVQGDGVNVPVTPVAVKVTVPLGGVPAPPAASLTATMQF